MSDIDPPGIASAVAFGSPSINPTWPSRFSGPLTRDAIVWRAPLIEDARYGSSKRDWTNAVGTNVRVTILPLISSENTMNREFTLAHWQLIGAADLDLEASDRLEFDGVMTEVDGPPFLWRDWNGLAHHVDARLKLYEG